MQLNKKESSNFCMDTLLRKRRNKDQKFIDISKIAPLYLQGLNYREIAERLGLSIKQVASDITTIKEDWRTAYIEDFNEYRKKELLKIDLIEAEAWRAWEASKKGRTSTIKSAEDSQQFGSRKSATEEHSNSYGEVQYLQTVQWCVTNRAKLLGMYGAAKIDNGDDAANEANKFSRDEVLSLIDSIAGRVAVAASQAPANLLEAMRNSPTSQSDTSEVIDAQYTEIQTPVKMISESSTVVINDIPESFEARNLPDNDDIADIADIDDPETVANNERSRLLEILRTRKAEKLPDPRYEVPRTRKDDIRTILTDLDATRVSSAIYEERMSELKDVSPSTSVTGKSIGKKHKITK